MNLLTAKAKFKISSKLLIAFLLVGLLVMFSFGYFFYKVAARVTLKESTLRVEAVVENKIDEIEYLFARIDKRIRMLALSPIIASETLSLAKNKNRNENKNNHLLESYFYSYLEEYDFNNILLISLAGDVLFTLKRESILYTNLKNGKYKESNLARIFTLSSETLQTQLSNYEFYLPGNSYSVFICTPIYVEKKIVGYLAAQIGAEEINKIANNYEGRAESEEIVLATNDKGNIRAVTSLRNNLNAIDENDTVMGKYNEKSQIPIHKALRGESGFGKSIDYRGKEVMASWRYVPSIKWGMVVKMDMEDAYASINELQKQLIVIAIIILLVVIIISKIVSNSFSRPIIKLTQIVSTIAKGDFSKRVEVDSSDEIGVLAGTVNEMASAIEKNHWQKNGQNLLSKLISERNQFENFYLDIIAFFAKYLNANAGTFYIKNFDVTDKTDKADTDNEESNRFTLAATYAINKNSQTIKSFNVGEGLLGQAVSSSDKRILSELPDDYLKLDLSDGTILLKHILIFPIILRDQVLAVFEFGGIKPFNKNHLDFLEVTEESIAYAIDANQRKNNQSNISNISEEKFI
ncbi:MAG: HAMP domain-containing protein [Oligoflexia bacterium]|nr:HAMP domain-containing protein [Oligoflexia bacterium]